MTYRDSILEKVRDIITEVIEVKPQDIHIDANLRNDLQVDSLASVEIVMALEDTFGVEIGEEQAAGLRTVGDLVEAIAKAQQSTKVSAD